MAYSRFSEGDIYLIKTTRPNVDEWECLTCPLDPNNESLLFYSLLDVREHLNTHEKAGHKFSIDAGLRVDAEINEMFKNNPTPENIKIAMQMFFSDESFINNLDWIFLSTLNSCQHLFLSELENIDFSVIWKDIRHYFIFLDYADQFNDKERVLRILKSWKTGIIEQMKKNGIDPQSPRDELSEKERSEERLLKAILGVDPDLKESLHDLRKVIAQLQSEK